MIRAAIDIGTNSTRLLIADFSDQVMKVIDKRVEITRLGEGVDERRILSKEAMARTVLTTSAFVKMAKEKGAKEIAIIATSAARDAKNLADFEEMIAVKTGCDLRVLSGQEEAQTAFAGATYRLAKGTQALVMDIGGGSTELILGRSGQIQLAKSFDFGSVRLTEMFLKGDPPQETEIKAMIDYVEFQAHDLFEQAKSWGHPPSIGVAGTITAVASISLVMKEYDPNLIDGFRLTISEVKRIFNLLVKMSLKERKTVIGLEPKRADIIIGGVAILYSLMNGLGLIEIIVSECDILDGIIISPSKPFSS